MHFHLPKPLHGWREFAGEVGIIVLGVLIALAAEQTVEELHWRTETARVERSLQAEIQDSVDAALERRVLDDCLRAQLVRLQATAMGQSKTAPVTYAGPTRVIPDLYFTPWRPWPRATWESAISSNATNHINHNRLAAYAYAYTAIGDIRLIIQQERARKGALAPLEGGSLTPEQHGSVLAALTDLDRNRADIMVASKTLVQMAGRLGVSPSEPLDRVARDVRRYSWFKPACEARR